MSQPFLSYGNYCGPGWSAGKAQASVVSDLRAVDAFDDTCKLHDASYAEGANLKTADYKFFSQNIGKGIMRSVAAIGVGVQGLLRGDENFSSNNKTEELSIMTKSKNRSTNGTVLNRLSIKEINALENALRAKRVRPIGKNGMPKRLSQMTGNKTLMAGVVAPSSKSYSTNAGAARFASTASGSTLISHREYIGTVSTATTFTTTTFECNPGSPITFPWLSQLANNYDRHKWRGLKFTYVPAVATSTAGRVTLAFNYNALDPAPASKAQIFSIAPNTEASVWTGMELNIPVRGGEMYNRSGLITGADLKTYDMGSFLFAADLGTGAAVCGELYVDYVVELLCPHPQIPFFTSLTATGTTKADVLPSATIVRGSTQASDSSTLNSFQINESGRYAIYMISVGTVITAQTLSASLGSFTTATGWITVGAVINSAGTIAVWISGLDVVVDPVQKFATITINNTATTITSTSVTVGRIDSNIAYPVL